jgi:hypothetical protein
VAQCACLVCAVNGNASKTAPSTKYGLQVESDVDLSFLAMIWPQLVPTKSRCWSCHKARPFVTSTCIETRNPPFLTVPAVPAFAGRTPGDKGAVSSFLANLVSIWHKNAINAHRNDYSRENGPNIASPKVPGPGCTGRALAMVHLAIYDAYVGISREGKTYLTYDRLPVVPGGTCPCMHQPCPCSHCW